MFLFFFSLFVSCCSSSSSITSGTIHRKKKRKIKVRLTISGALHNQQTGAAGERQPEMPQPAGLHGGGGGRIDETFSLFFLCFTICRNEIAN